MKNLIFGHGINDADYVVCPTINGKRVWCPYYKAWANMLRRVYDPNLHAKRPTYAQTTVDPDWLFFSVFREWMLQQDWKGMHLDKDILHPGNKHYCPDECVFISHALNTLLLDCAAARGEWSEGVSWKTQNQKFQAQITINGKRKYIGLFSDPTEASLAYRKRKVEYIRDHRFMETDPRIQTGLLRHAMRYYDAESWPGMVIHPNVMEIIENTP